jgi:hypothetical protein
VDTTNVLPIGDKQFTFWAKGYEAANEGGAPEQLAEGEVFSFGDRGMACVCGEVACRARLDNLPLQSVDR